MGRQKIDLAGIRFGRLVVVEDSGLRSTKGEVMWACICDCGNPNTVLGGNLKSGSVSSCGCLARELSSARAAAKSSEPKPKCSVADCAGEAREFARTLCRKHAKRMRRYGDPLFVTPEDVRVARQRDAILANITRVKPNTYRKLFGRHEHRVIGEEIAGRPLLSSEHVHHKDEDKHNNDRDNLEVMSAADHLRYHAKKRAAEKANA